MTCQEYQADLMIKATYDKAAQETKQMLEVMLMINMSRVVQFIVNSYKFVLYVDYAKYA